MSTRLRAILLSILIALAIGLTAGCQKKDQPTTSLTQHQWREVKKHLLEEAPQPDYPIGANFEGKIELIGFDVDGELEPGNDVTFTWYWKALKDLDKNWEIFVHFDHKSDGYRQHLDHQPLDGLYQTGRWSEGQIIKDVQNVKVDSKYPPGKAVPYIGLYRGSGVSGRLKVTNEVETDGERRLIGPELTIGGDVETPSYEIPFAETDGLTIDGQLIEKLWDHDAPITLEAMNGGALDTEIVALATKKGLLVGAKMEDNHIWSDLEKRDSKTWTQEVIEIFIDPNRDNEDYVELQITPNGTVFDAKFETRLSRESGEREKQIAKASNWDLDFKYDVFIKGTLNDKKSKDTLWSVEALIPYSQIPGVSASPKKGDKWAVNFYRYDRPDDKTTHNYGWSTAITGDFHDVRRFGSLVFPAMPSTGDGTSKEDEGSKTKLNKLDLELKNTRPLEQPQIRNIDPSQVKNEAAQ
jgi:hypothetical protein